jgi:hypothetical protein
MSSKLKQIYSVFSPSPLQPEQNDLYIDLEEVRGKTGIVNRMAQKIRLADAPTCQVLTGHRGSGKSTELSRLGQALQDPPPGEPRFFAVQIQADDELDRNDIDFPEVLIAIVRQVADQLRTREKIELKPGYFPNLWDRLKNFAFTEVSLDKIELGASLAKLSATIKNSPEAREQVRKALEPDTNNWLTAANDVIGDAVLQLDKKRFSGLVVIVDDLDKMITRPHGSAGCSTTEYLFIHRSEQLKAFQCHLIYTLPIELAYSHHESTIRQLYGGHLPVVPMTKLSTPPPKSKTHPLGVKKFREIITARLKSVEAAEVDLFQTNKVRDDLIKLTGGQPTELMSMVREAIITEGIPIGSAGVKRCRTEAMRSYRRQLRSDHWPLIEEVRLTGQVVRTKENESAFRELLDSRAILLYENDKEWYALNPAIEDLPPPVVSGPNEVVS